MKSSRTIQIRLQGGAMTMQKRAVGSRLTAASLMVTGVSLVHAQTSPVELTEIVVTAQKRVEVLQDVPLSLAVIPAEQLQAFSFNETTDIQYLVPGVTLSNTAGPRNFGFFIRGIGTSSFASESIEGSVGYVLDG